MSSLGLATLGQLPNRNSKRLFSLGYLVGALTGGTGGTPWVNGSGWASGCGPALFTLGWVGCGTTPPVNIFKVVWASFINKLLGGGDV